MNTEETTAELAATVDYLADITEHAETYDFDEAVDLTDALVKVRKAADTAIGMIQSEMLRQLEGSGARVRGKRLFKRSKKWVVRHDHETIRNAVIDHAVDKATNRATGEIDARTAIRSAATALASAYVSPSSTAKVTVLDALGLDRDAYVSRESKGYQLVVEDLEGDDDENA